MDWKDELRLVAEQPRGIPVVWLIAAVIVLIFLGRLGRMLYHGRRDQLP